MRNSRITNVVRSIYNQIIPEKDFSQEPVSPIMKAYQNEDWPLDSKKGNRPHTFCRVVIGAADKARELKSTHSGQAVLLEELAVKLESLQLSRAAQQVAKGAYVN